MLDISIRDSAHSIVCLALKKRVLLSLILLRDELLSFEAAVIVSGQYEQIVQLCIHCAV